MMKISVLVVLCFLAFQVSSMTPQVDVFTYGEGGYMCFRIPAILETPNALIAMAEGRGLNSQNFNCCSSPVEDFPWCNDKDIVMKSSYDGGVTWGDLIVTPFRTTTQYFYSNPTPVYFPAEDVILMLVTRCEVDTLYNQCVVNYTLGTEQNGDWSWETIGRIQAPPFAPLAGPPSGIVTSEGQLVFPMTTSEGTFALFSDDSNVNSTFNVTAGYFVEGSVGESQITELPGQLLMIGIRDGKHEDHHYFAYSKDYGQTWTPPFFNQELPTTACQGSLLYSTTYGQVFFSIPTEDIYGDRSYLTIYSSLDYGIIFEYYEIVSYGPSAYSALIELKADGRVGILYENGVDSPYETISIAFLDSKK